MVSPIGDAWQLNYQKPNALRLHVGDNGHPNFSGTYLSALVLYITIYSPKNLNLSYHGPQSFADARYLPKVASEAIFESSEKAAQQCAGANGGWRFRFRFRS